MQRTEDKTFTDEQGSLDVKSVQLPALRAFRLMNRLAKLVGGSLTGLRGVGFKADIKHLAPILAELFDRLDPDESEALAIQILSCTLVVANGKAVTLANQDAIDGVFGGRLMTMLKVMAFALEVNYRDFFRELLKAAGEAQPPQQIPPANP